MFLRVACGAAVSNSFRIARDWATAAGLWYSILAIFGNPKLSLIEAMTMSSCPFLRFHSAIAFAALSCGVMLSMPAAHAASGERIGDAVVITNIVMADFAEKQRKLAKGDDVRQDETIEVNTDAQGEFKLDDETKLALGPGSRLVLDKFVYDSDKKAGSIVINLAKGAFRFITGVATKPTYVINTPNASITVRGTIFDAYILPDKSVWVLLHEGALEATGSKNVCRVLDQPGQLIRISDSGEIGEPVNWSKLPDNAAVAFDTAFPFVTNTPTIDPNPALTREAIVSAAFPQTPDKTCINPHSPFKIQKADTPAPKPKKVHDTKPTKTAKRTRDDDDVGSGGMTGIGIVIGGGLGGFGGHHHGSGDGGRYHSNDR